MRSQARARTTEEALRLGPHISPHHHTEVGMTRTDVMASSRPQAEGTAKLGRRSSGARRRLIVVPVLLLLAVALAAPTSAVAAETTNKEGLSGYGKTEEKKAEETKKPEEAKKPEEKAGTSPSKETS